MVFVLPTTPKPGEQVACPAPGCLYWATVTRTFGYPNQIFTKCPLGHEEKTDTYSVVKFDNPELTRARPE